MAIWNGLDSSTAPWTVTKYDNVAIYTGILSISITCKSDRVYADSTHAGSAFVIDGAGPGGKGPGVVNL